MSRPPQKRPQVEMVVSHYQEDLSWIRPWGDITRVYHKGGYADRLKLGMGLWGARLDTLDNVGRESHTYLYHIVNNWDSLADWTVFFQGSGPSWGYSITKKEMKRLDRLGVKYGGHLCSGVQTGDYIRNRNPLFYIRTAEVQGDLTQQRMRTLYTQYYSQFELSRFGINRVESYPLLNHFDRWGKWFNFREFRNFVDKKRSGVDNQYNFTLPEFWSRYISYQPFPKTIVFAQGAQFSVHRELIHQRPLLYYQRLLELLSMEKDPYLGYYMEWVWGEIWNPSCET